jgi:hypothetical protein
MNKLLLVAALAIGCGSPPSSGTDVDAGGDALDVGEPEVWTWHDVPGMVCGDGSPTGIAINPSSRSNKLVILFEGGGACWEAAACYGILIPKTASHLDGFNEQTFTSQARPYFDNHWAFQRTDATSLFNDATWVFVPYCTGDLHAGTQTTVYEAGGQMATMHHVGAHNVDAMLAQIAPLAPSEVFAMGISAGGFGAQLNWDRIAAAFPGVPTHLLADGAQLVPIESGRWSTMKQRWAPRFPDGCTDCATGMDKVAAHWHSAHASPGARYALMESLQDGVLSLYFGYDAPGMRTVSLAAGNAFTGADEAVFMIDDNSHTMLNLPNTKTSTNVVLRGWVEAWANGTSAFTTAGP